MDYIHPLLASMFSDETEAYRFPAEPDAGDLVTIRFRSARAADGVTLVWNDTELPMKKVGSDKYYDRYEVAVTCPDTLCRYHFLIKCAGVSIRYLKDGAGFVSADTPVPENMRFRFTPGFHTPKWAQGAVQYQIFTDRFCSGDAKNDVQTGEYAYGDRQIRRMADWNAPPPRDGYRCFYGGDIQGILDKLDYLQGLGVEVLYLNPIFLSPSSHKYDTQDYTHIDPHFGVIEDDIDTALPHGDLNNAHAERYIRRVTSEVNLAKSDALFADLCKELHRRGMKIILDGVFNHCGSFHRWMDREGIYRDKEGSAPGAYQNPASPYRAYFRFTDKKPGYDAWWGVETLPKLCYEQSRELCEEIFSVAEQWLRPPYSIDGWRLDVAADLGHSPKFNHAFWREFRKRVKAVNPDAVILAEHYGDPSDWLCGDEWDTVMNYDAFMEPLTYFLTGLDKHSDTKNETLLNDGKAFFDAMNRCMARFQQPSLLCAMNELSNHDHSRFLTRTNRRVGRMEKDGCPAAGKGIDKGVFRMAVAVQMTWPGAPTVYYADEAGQVGWTDPDNRRTYPWGHEDHSLIELHRELIGLRKKYPVLRNGSLKPLFAGDGTIAFARFNGESCVLTACNNTKKETFLPLRLRDAEVSDGEALDCLILTGQDGHTLGGLSPLVSNNGNAMLRLPPMSAAIFAR